MKCKIHAQKVREIRYQVKDQFKLSTKETVQEMKDIERKHYLTDGVVLFLLKLKGK